MKFTMKYMGNNSVNTSLYNKRYVPKYDQAEWTFSFNHADLYLFYKY